MARKKTGKIFETETARSLAYLNDPKIALRIPDVQGARFVLEKAVDFVMLWRGQGWLIECKASLATSFPLSNIQEHQLVALREAAKSGNQGILLISMRKYKPPATFAVHIYHLMKFWPKDRKSLTMDWLEKYGVSLPWINIPTPHLKTKTKHGWNLEKLEYYLEHDEIGEILESLMPAIL